MRRALELSIALPSGRLRSLLIFSTTTIRQRQLRRALPLSSLFSLPISSSAAPMAAADDAANYGFEREEMYINSLANTVDAYDRHVFLCYKSYDAWPPRVEDSETDPLPKLLNSTIKARKADMPLKTRLTVCSESNELDFTDGDVLIFPEMVKYRGLKESDVDAFVDDVLVNGKPWSSGAPESLSGAYIFVCAHTSRDKRCGVCGPVLIEKFEEGITSRVLNEHVFVTACSHIGGHKYAGNIIIFGTNAQGKVIGDWYGYVTPQDVPELLDLHVGKGEIIEKLWRGQMGLKKDETVVKSEKKKKPSKETETPSEQESSFSCCQGAAGVSCCRDASSEVNGEVGDAKEKKTSEGAAKNCGACLSTWLGKWEQSDVLMAVGVVGAVATVAVAYSVFRKSA